MLERNIFTSTVCMCLKPRPVIGSRTFIVRTSLLRISVPLANPNATAPFNLLALGIFRPLRLFLPSDDKFRQARIILLKVTHLPIVGAIQLYEFVNSRMSSKDGPNSLRGPRQNSMKKQPEPPLGSLRTRPRNPSPRPTSSDVINRPPAGRPRQLVEDDEAEAPSDMEVRIAELSSKIDRLTSLVATLQPGAGIEASRM
jgi:hypothetical protein